jgi:6-hydroxytryprostatin B O-methyltransferase
MRVKLTRIFKCGGSIGHVSLEIAKANPNLTLIVQDFAALKPQFDVTIPSDFKNRISFQAHDIFTLQPIKGASVYLFKHILHNWPDGKCIEILRNVVPAMEKGSKIVVMEGVMPEIGEVGKWIDKITTSADLQMMVGLNAKERTKADWERLMARADKRLRVEAFRLPPGSAATLIEVVLESSSTKYMI